MTFPEVSIIVPALNEAENLGLLVPQVDAALAGVDYEILVVDDNSRDGTPAVCATLAERYPLRLIVRTEPTNGLSGAVLAGMAQAKGEYFIVMDADLQHPPERLPDLLRPLRDGSADFTLGSRYVPGGSTGETWTIFRRINSRIATALARPFAGDTRDPMSGFFALRQDRFRSAQRLTPLGYKIGLELMCKCRVRQVREVPIHFAVRQRGRSKLTLKEQWRYVEHLSRLYDFTYPHLSPIAKFLIVMTVGWLIGGIVFVALLSFGAAAGFAAMTAYLGVIAVEMVFYNRYIHTQREFLLTRRPWSDFALIATAELLTTGAVAWWASRRLNHPRAVELFVLSFGAATVLRYVLRKELLQDVRGLRLDVRGEELK